MENIKKLINVEFIVDPKTKTVYLTKPGYTNDQKINLTDNYLWAVDEEKRTVDLVDKKSKRKKSYKYYSFLDIPEEYEKLFNKNQLKNLDNQ